VQRRVDSPDTINLVECRLERQTREEELLVATVNDRNDIVYLESRVSSTSACFERGHLQPAPVCFERDPCLDMTQSLVSSCCASFSSVHCPSAGFELVRTSIPLAWVHAYKLSCRYPSIRTLAWVYVYKLSCRSDTNACRCKQDLFLRSVTSRG
jgi:hypothetical protein